jgi:hypothetical protein
MSVRNFSGIILVIQACMSRRPRDHEFVIARKCHRTDASAAQVTQP